MNKDWTYRKIGDILRVERGGSPRPIEKYLTDEPDGLNWIKISDATSSGKYIYETKEKIKKEGLHKSRLVEEGDFILTNSMSFGRPYIMKTMGCIHDGWLVLKEREKGLLDKDFLYHLLGSPYMFAQFDKLAAGSTVRNLNIGLVSSVKIPIPPLQQQQQIVSILDEVIAVIDQAKANIEKNIQNAKELFQSKLNAIFSQKGDGWEEKKLSDLGKTQTGTTPPTNDNSNYGDFIPFVKPAHFKPDGSIESGDCMLSESGLKKGRLFEANSVLMVCIGATIGKTGYTEIAVSSNQQINALTPNENYEPKLLYYALISPFVQKQVLIEGKGAQATLPIINKSKWEKIRVFVPSNKLVQTKIINQLDELNTSTKIIEATYKTKLTQLVELKKAILQKAFAGELTNKSVTA